MDYGSTHMLENSEADAPRTNADAPRSSEGWEKYLQVAAPQGAQGTVRIAALLRIVAAHNTTGMKISEIASLAKLEQPTAHRIVTALNSVGFLSRNPETRRYHLGPLLFELFTTAFPHFNIQEICQPAMRALADTLGDSVLLTVRSGFDGVCVDRQEGTYPIRTCTVDVGRRRPMGIGAGSIALLAAHSPAEVETIIEHNRERYLSFNTTAEDVMRRVENAREQGYVYQEVLHLPEIKAVAMAITGKTGHPFAAISITAIASRIPEQRVPEMVGALRQKVNEISEVIAQQGYV